MQLILLQNVQNLGKLGDKVDVKPGYARNFLVPQGKATPATATNLAEFEARRAEYEAKAKTRHDEAEARRAGLADVSITIRANAVTEGKLYGSITANDIAEELTKLGHPVQKSEVIMGKGAIQHTGTYEVVVHFHSDVEANVTVVVEGDVA